MADPAYKECQNLDDRTAMRYLNGSVVLCSIEKCPYDMKSNKWSDPECEGRVYRCKCNGNVVGLTSKANEETYPNQLEKAVA